MASGVTISQLAKAAGVNIETVRFYERRKLLQPTTRTPSGYRLYGPTENQRLRFIKNAQALGFTLHEITEMLNLRLNSRARCGDVLRQTQIKLTQVETKIQALQAMAHSLERVMRACREGLPTEQCPIHQGLEQDEKGTASEQGPPARTPRAPLAGNRKAGKVSP